MPNTKIFNKPYILVKDQDILNLAIERSSLSNIIIPHVCNNVNAFGAGFAGYIASRYPQVKENFHLLGNKAKLGYTQFIDIYHNKSTDNKVIIANMIAQNGLINHNNRRPLNYFALCACMNMINNYMLNIKKEDTSVNVEIHAPKFGSGLAGGDWKFISNLIEDIWNSHTVMIYQI
jgi:hypothetical protein